MDMASLVYSLLSSLLFLSFLYPSINGDSIGWPNTACPSIDCGNGIIVGYPFWQQSQGFEHCGYPGFNVSCNDHNPIMHLSSDLYVVEKIDYSDKSLIVTHSESREGNCPKVSHDVKLGPLFNHTFGNKMLHFFYNCTLYPPSLPSILCLLYGHKRSFVFMEEKIPEFDWHRYCESIVTVPVIDQIVDRDLVQGMSIALQDGFRLRWQQPDGACQSCESSGGLCGYGNSPQNNFFCTCADGRHSINCSDKGSVSIQTEPNYVVIGALVFGGLISAATIFYFIQKRRILSYKPVRVIIGQYVSY